MSNVILAPNATALLLSVTEEFDNLVFAILPARWALLTAPFVKAKLFALVAIPANLFFSPSVMITFVASVLPLWFANLSAVIAALLAIFEFVKVVPTAI